MNLFIFSNMGFISISDHQGPALGRICRRKRHLWFIISSFEFTFFEKLYLEVSLQIAADYLD